jgi:predicted permease
VRDVDAGFLRAFGVLLLRGRWFTEADAAGTQKVCVVDSVLVNRYWPGQDGVGKRIERNNELCVIVGVVAPVKNKNLAETISKETIYFPYAQAPDTNLSLVVRSAGDPAALTTSLRAAVNSVDPEQPVYDVKTMTQRMEDVAQPRRAPMILLSLFSGVALLLASLGVYGVLAFSVAQRTAEFGIRLALGATARDIGALVVGEGGRLVAAGIVTGLAGYLAVSRIIARLLYGVSTADPAALVIAPLILAIVAIVASILPARRATKVDPMVALRAE